MIKEVGQQLQKVNASQLCNTCLPRGGPSLSIRGLVPLYDPGVGVLGRARFACTITKHVSLQLLQLSLQL